jgi:uncharacterized protein
MLLEFTVNNFVCFSNDVTFSFEAMEDFPDGWNFNPESRRVLKDIVDNESKPITINTVNAIYGKNASGKSSFLDAIMRLRALIVSSRRIDDDDDFRVVYYNESPMHFKIRFIVESNVYRYNVTLEGEDSESAKIVEEELYNESRGCFEYRRNDMKVTQCPKDFFNKEQLEILGNDLNSKHLVLSQPFTFLQKFREPFTTEFFDKYNGFFELPLRLRKGLPFGFALPKQMQKLCEERKSDLLKRLQQADFSITDFNINDEGELEFLHADKKKRDFSEQSDGTRKYFFLFLDLLPILENGGLYIVDEIDKALHPILTKHLVELFKNFTSNPKNARLLFSTHDEDFMHQSVLNGDQIWLLDRDEATGEGTLKTVADFDDFNPLGVLPDYLNGYYGAVPKLQENA